MQTKSENRVRVHVTFINISTKKLQETIITLSLDFFILLTPDAAYCDYYILKMMNDLL